METITSNTSSQEKEAQAVCGAVASLFGKGELWQKSQAVSRQWLDDTAEILASRDVSSPVIAFVGQRNTGKSTLVRSLILSEESKQQVPCGISSANKTKKLYWIGNEQPRDLDPEREIYLSLKDDELEDLGTPYTLLDTPGSSDGEMNSSSLLKRAEDRADVFVLIAYSDQLEVEQVFTDIQPANGGTFLPVIRLSPKSTRVWSENEDNTSLTGDIHTAVRNWREHLPLSKFLDPLLIPDWDAVDELPDGKVPAKILADGLRNALQEEEVRTTGRYKRVMATQLLWRENIARILQPFFDHAQDSLSRLEKAESGMHEDILEWLLEGYRPVDIEIKWTSRQMVLDRISPLLFPITGLWKIISLTSGAWDRLVWAAGGSIFALLGAGRKTWSNLSEKSKNKGDGKSDLVSALDHHIGKKFKPLLNNVAQDMAPFSHEKSDAEKPALHLEILGLESLSHTWKEKEPSIIRKFQISAWLLYPAVLLCFAFFWWMVGGPFVHLYVEYIPAVFSSWSGDWSSHSLQNYPNTGPGFWFTTFFLALFPTFIMGMLVTHSVSSTRKVKAIRSELRKQMSAAMKSGNMDLRIRTNDRTLETLTELLPFRTRRQSKKNIPMPALSE